MSEVFFGKNIKEAIKWIKGLFKKEEEIVDCPFCHSYQIKKNYRLKNDKKTFSFYVQCSNCKCCGPVGNDYTEALKLWNDRSE